jgi:hypothetical protein
MCDPKRDYMLMTQAEDARMPDTEKHGQIMTKTVRSRFDHEVGESVEGYKILEKSIIAPPDPIEKRRGIYDYLVEMPPEIVKTRSSREPAAREAARNAPPTRDSYTRSTPDERGGRVIRRIPSR